MAITNKHIFDEIRDLRLEIKGDMIELGKEVNENTSWRNQITGKLTILFIGIGIGVNFLVDWLQQRFKSS